MLTRYGTSNIIIMLASGLILIVIAFFLSRTWLSYSIGVIGCLLILFTLWFFRDPERNIPKEAIENGSIILSPADGKVLEILDTTENIYLKCPAKRISIFLSPLDVHVNRSPASGVIKYFKYCPGDYLVAYYPKASEKNEQSHIGLENEFGKIFFKQIVGILARRLVWDIKEGDTLKAGQRFGMMKFGSRMDIFVPAGTDIFTKVGNHVVGGETIIAKLKIKNNSQ